MRFKIALLLLAVAALFSCEQNTKSDTLSARALLDSAIVAHGGQKFEGATIEFGLNNYDFALKRDGYNYDYMMYQERDSAMHTVKTFNGGITYHIDDSLVDPGARQITLIRERVNNVAYDFYIPLSFTGNDVVLTYLGQENMRLKPYHKLKVTYKQIEGAEPDERAYVLWMDADTYEIDFIAKQNETTSGRKQFMADIKPARGIFYMILSVAGLTLYHLFAKIAYNRNNKLTNIDCLAFVGLANFTIYLVSTMINGVSLSILNFTPKVLMYFILSL